MKKSRLEVCVIVHSFKKVVKHTWILSSHNFNSSENEYYEIK